MTENNELIHHKKVIIFMKYSISIIACIVLVSILRTIFNHTIHIDFNKWWIQFIFELMITTISFFICLIYLFPRGVKPLSISLLKRWFNRLYIFLLKSLQEPKNSISLLREWFNCLCISLSKPLQEWKNSISLLRERFNRLCISLSKPLQEWKNIIFLSINIGIIINYVLINGPITFRTGDLLSDLFDGAMLLAILNMVIFLGDFYSKNLRKILV
ncbi:hypothetical protein [Paenibacillus nuruki]|uniref:hypothetical protein n=1 Tax=Paenibacillus nuruki TaxID=1886670 RepID=UPI002804340B|nr:hypothetical protein [Paenibacillus nuruki]CAJ1315325.1 hypothetical protein AASFL403_08915 [Paenibacillus nuruki]